MSTSTRTEQRDNSNWLTIQFRRVLSSPREDIYIKRIRKRKKEKRNIISKKGRKKGLGSDDLVKSRVQDNFDEGRLFGPAPDQRHDILFMQLEHNLSKRKEGEKKLHRCRQQLFLLLDGSISERDCRTTTTLAAGIHRFNPGNRNGEREIQSHLSPNSQASISIPDDPALRARVSPVIRTRERERTRPAPSGETSVRMLHCPGRKVMKSASVCVTLDLLLILRFT